MNNHTFTIRLAAPHMNVDTLSLRELAELLEAFHSLLSQAERALKDASTTEPLRFSLVGVRESGSVSYPVLASDHERGLAIYRQSVSVLQRRHKDRRAAKEARRIQVLAARWRTPVECYGVGATTPDIIVETDELVDTPTIKGQTTLYGVLIRVGGVDPKAALQLEKNKTLTIDLDREFARRLAPKLYHPVGLNGIAEWDLETWEIINFQAETLLDYEPVPYTQAFEELAQASPRAWSNEFLETIPDFRDHGVGEE